MHAARRIGRLIAVALVAVAASACSDDSPDDDNPPSPGTGALDTPEGVSDAGSTIVDPEVPASNVSNEQEAPLDPPGS